MVAYICCRVSYTENVTCSLIPISLVLRNSHTGVKNQIMFSVYDTQQHISYTTALPKHSHSIGECQAIMFHIQYQEQVRAVNSGVELSQFQCIFEVETSTKFNVEGWISGTTYKHGKTNSY